MMQQKKLLKETGVWKLKAEWAAGAYDAPNRVEYYVKTGSSSGVRVSDIHIHTHTLCTSI